MDSRDLEKIFSEDTFVAPHFRGVYPRDLFCREFVATQHPSVGFYVFNTDDSSRPGAHWIAVHATGESVTYFDSYAFPPHIFPDVNAALRSRQRRRLVWNRVPMQGLLSTVCGDYCALFCLLVSRGWTLDDVCKRMMSFGDSERRDHAVRATVVDLYGARIVGNYSLSPELEGANGVHVPGSGYEW
jgi:hypothetical protein